MTQTDQKTAGNGGAAPRSEPTAGQSDLDTLLKEFETSETKPDIGRVLRPLEPVIEFARTEMAGRAKKEVEDDINKALDYSYEAEELKGVPKRFVRGYYEAYASENPDFVQAFTDRGKNPKGWKAALEGARTEMVKEWKEVPTNTIRTDVEAARAAISGTVQPGEAPKLDPRKLMKMSGSEYRAMVEEEIAKNEG